MSVFGSADVIDESEPARRPPAPDSIGPHTERPIEHAALTNKLCVLAFGRAAQRVGRAAPS
jgi:hypothetical protein